MNNHYSVCVCVCVWGAGVCSLFTAVSAVCVCVFVCVCVHLDVSTNSEYGSPYLATHHVLSFRTFPKCNHNIYYLHKVKIAYFLSDRCL